MLTLKQGTWSNEIKPEIERRILNMIILPTF